MLPQAAPSAVLADVQHDRQEPLRVDQAALVLPQPTLSVAPNARIAATSDGGARTAASRFSGTQQLPHPVLGEHRRGSSPAGADVR